MKTILKWLSPLLFIGLGIYCTRTIYGHDFLGLMSFGIAGIICIYNFIGLLRRRFLLVRIFRTIFTTILCLLLIAFAITEVLVIRGSQGKPGTEFSYLVVLGCKVNGTTPSLSLNDRIEAAYDYLADNPEVTAVLSGGKGNNEDISEAQCMFNELTRMGIAPERLWMEDQATSTWENLQFSLNLIQEKTGQRPASIGILSSEYHLYRAGIFAEECGVNAALIPAHTSMRTIQLNYSLREVPVLWKHFIFGG